MKQKQLQKVQISSKAQKEKPIKSAEKKLDSKKKELEKTKTRTRYTIEQIKKLLSIMSAMKLTHKPTEFAKLMNIPVSTIKNWKRKNKKWKVNRKNYEFFDIVVLERALYDKLLTISSTRRISRNVIENEATKIARSMIRDKLRKENTNLTEADLNEKVTEILLKIDFPNRYWLRKFNKDRELYYEKQVGDAPTVDLSKHEKEIVELQKIVAMYELQDVYNLDETGLYYNGFEKYFYTIGGRYAPKAQNKQRITYVMCSNCYGQCLKPIIIGKHSPRNVSNDHQYFSNDTAWMTGYIFKKILNEWNDELKLKGRRVLLLVDNFSGHADEGYSNIQVEFLPPNTTSKVQPMDLGIIANFKRIFKVLRNDDDHHHSISNLTMNQCFELATRAMVMIKPATFWNCFKSSPVFMKKMNQQDVPEDPAQPLSIEFNDEPEQYELDDELYDELVTNYVATPETTEKTEEDKEHERILEACKIIALSGAEHVDTSVVEACRSYVEKLLNEAGSAE